MKANLLIIPLAGALAFAAAIQAEDTANSVAAPVVSLAPTNSPTVVAPTDTAPLNTAAASALGERIVRPDVITAKPATSGSRKVWAAINPFAPMKPEPATPWLSRAAWGTAAPVAATTKSDNLANHESQMGVVICSQ